MGHAPGPAAPVIAVLSVHLPPGMVLTVHTSSRGGEPLPGQLAPLRSAEAPLITSRLAAPPALSTSAISSLGSIPASAPPSSLATQGREQMLIFRSARRALEELRRRLEAAKREQRARRAARQAARAQERVARQSRRQANREQRRAEQASAQAERQARRQARRAVRLEAARAMHARRLARRAARRAERAARFPLGRVVSSACSAYMKTTSWARKKVYLRRCFRQDCRRRQSTDASRCKWRDPETGLCYNRMAQNFCERNPQHARCSLNPQNPLLGSCPQDVSSFPRGRVRNPACAALRRLRPNANARRRLRLIARCRRFPLSPTSAAARPRYAPRLGRTETLRHSARGHGRSASVHGTQQQSTC